jgi:hypothetical protein
MSLVAVSSNVSFITSIGDAGLGIPASESPFLYSILKGKGKEETSENLLDLFNGSITKISDYLNKNKNNANYCAAGFQELNNTKDVHDRVDQIIKEKNLTFICKNTIDEYMSTTYPTSGFIIADFDPTKFKQIKENKIHSYSRKLTRVIDLDGTNGPSSYSFNTELSQYMSVRDLGTPHEFTKDEKKYVFLKNNKSPDAGRCIGMVVKMKDDETIDVIHINCHMVNPSALKVFEITGDTLTSNDTNYIVTDITGVTDKTIMQLEDNDFTNEWLNYCVKRLNECINEMLVDFDLKAINITDETKFVLTGDLNDSDGLLIQKLSGDEVKIEEKIIKFTSPSKRLFTACPNVNSTKVVIDGMDPDTKKRGGFNKSFNYLKQLFPEEKDESKKPDKDILQTYYLIKDDDVTKLVTNPANYAFEGDVVLFGKVDGGLSSDNGFVDGESSDNNLNITTKDDILNQTSDHLFVWGKTTPVSLVGGRRKTRKNRKTKKKSHLKKNSKKKNTRKR